PCFGGPTGGADNLPGWRNTPFMKHMYSRLGVPVFSHNDVTTITLGEARHGAGNGKNNIVMASFGTGIGGGIIINGKLYEGATGYAGEIGHFCVDKNGFKCSCGITGCWEEYASVRGIIRTAESVLAYSRDKQTLIQEMVAHKHGKLTPEAIFDAAGKNDPVALQIVDEIGSNTARGIGGLINIFNPDLFIIGGGIAGAGKIYLDAIKRHIAEWTLPDSLQSTQLVLARLGDKAGIIGASLLVFENINCYKE
ncbi:MAG: ROK family protein, partial [Spirochaetota bacterium]